MAISKNKSISDLYGRIGNIIIYERNGKLVARSRPRQTKKAPTPNRKINQTLFTQTQAIVRATLPFIRVGFAGYTEEHSAYHEAMSVNLRQDIFNSSLAGETDYSQCILGRGELPGTARSQVRWVEPHKAEVTWDINPGTGGYPTDQVMLLVYAPVMQQSVTRLDAAQRGEGSVMVDIPVNLRGMGLEVFLVFINPGRILTGDKRRGISDSQYAGHLE